MCSVNGTLGNEQSKFIGSFLACITSLDSACFLSSVPVMNPVVHDKKDTTQLNPFEKEVLRVVRLMPKWKPAICHGKEVAAEVNRPLVICIRLEKV